MAELEARVSMGSFEVDTNTGALFARDDGIPPCFGFDWRDRRIEARLDGDTLHVVAWVGRVPSSATHVPRVPAFEMLRALPRALPEAWKVTLEASHTVRIEVEIWFDGPITAAILVTGLTSRMLAMAPYLDLLEEAGVAC